MGKLRVWYYEEFKDCEGDVDCLADRAWPVPDQKPILFAGEPSPITDVKHAAELYAAHFHNQRDGWECTWPIEFVVHDGEQYFLIEIDREMVAEFWASKPRQLLVGSAGTIVTVTPVKSA
jgi:hypothetical protein